MMYKLAACFLLSQQDRAGSKTFDVFIFGVIALFFCVSLLFTISPKLIGKMKATDSTINSVGV